jgi:ankyrin repeat protein
MKVEPLRAGAPVDRYRDQAARLLDAWRAGDPDALHLFHTKHPKFLHTEVRWLPKRLTDDELRSTPIDLEDARLALARSYDFARWETLAAHAEQAAQPGSAVARFEAAVDATVDGDLDALTAMLRVNPDLVRARSSRITHFDPPVHRATLLHYVAANGVEGHRQRTPPNAVAVARALLEAGADADALAEMYGGRHTTMSMLVSSAHPARAGLQAVLVDLLVDFGASVDGAGTGAWASPLMTALAFGYRDAADALVRRGARVDRLAAAAGLGRLAEAGERLAAADAAERHRAIALAAQHGHGDVVRLLLDAGEDPNRYNPQGHHAHSTPMHQAAVAGRLETVRLLVERGARLDIRDRIHDGTPLGWAIHGGQSAVAAYLRSVSAPD